MRVSAKLHGATFRVASLCLAAGLWDCADIEDDQMMVSEDGNDDKDDDNDTFIA